MDNKWSEFKLRVNIRVPLDKVYPAWATPAGLESWFLRKAAITCVGGTTGTAGTAGTAGTTGTTGGAGAAGAAALRPAGSFIQKGDRYEFYWHGYPENLSEKGIVTAANGTNHFAFTFTKDCPVSVSLCRECDETIVELVESGMAVDEATVLRQYVGDSKGWIFYLTNLKSVLEGGLDLRNCKTELGNVITA